MDYSKYKLTLNIKSVCLFEKMAEKSFYKCNTDVDIAILMYCSLVSNNDLQITYQAFLRMMEDAKFSRWLANEYGAMMAFLSQFSATNIENDNTDNNAETLKISDLAMTLIVKYGLDPHYVMNEMKIYEMGMFLNATADFRKEELEEKRMWAYINVMPHIDHKKCKSPEQLLPFPWNKDERKKRAEKELKNNMYAIQHTIGMKLNL